MSEEKALVTEMNSTGIIGEEKPPFYLKKWMEYIIPCKEKTGLAKRKVRK